MKILGKLNIIKNFWFNLEKIEKFLFIFLIFSFLIRVIFLFYHPMRGWDETVYLNLAHDLSNNPLLYSLKNSGWNDFIPYNNTLYSWPNIGFRAPIIPYFFSFFYFFDLAFLIPYIIPLFATLSIYLIYILGKELFDKRVGLYSAIFFSLIPINIYTSEKIWADSFVLFFIILIFINFWKGYEKGNIKNKVLFGLFMALAVLTRYTALWVVPVFLLYFLIRDKSFKFLRDKYLWYAIGVFFLIMIPWFIYGFNYYGNIFGGFIHGFKAASYWGGVQPWYYFFENSWRIFSLFGIFSFLSLAYIFIKKEILKKEVYLLVIWLVFVFIMILLMPHKEDRYIMPIIPAASIIAGLFINKLKRFRNIVLILISIVLIYSGLNAFRIEYVLPKDKATLCFLQNNDFLKNNIKNDSLVVTNQSTIVHYYTDKDTVLYPSIWDLELFRDMNSSNYKNKDVYLSFSNYDMDMNSIIKKELDFNFEKVFECSIDYGYGAIYKYK